MSNQTFRMNASQFSCSLEGSQISLNFLNPYGSSEDLAEYVSGGCNDLNSQSGIAFVNIDSYEPESSDGEEDDAQDKSSLAREEASVFQETLDNMFSELERDTETYTGLQSCLPAHNHTVSREHCEEAGPIPFMKYFSIDSDLDCPNNRTFIFFAEDQAVLKMNPPVASYETQQIQNIVDVGIRSPMAIANSLNVSKGKADQENSPELVVRPKIRKQNTTNQLEREKLLPSGEEGSDSWRRTEIAEVQQDHAECVLRNSKEDLLSSILFNSRACEGHQRSMETGLKKNLSAREQKNLLNSTFEDEFEDRGAHFPVSHRDESSSEYSDGEWSASLSTYFTATEKDRSSSDESWETDPDRREHEFEVQSNNSDIEENTGISCEEGEQILLEEGEIPWLQYREEVESSSDEEDDPVTDFVHPGFFLLDGNNNLEDDSSVSEDLDVEWRLLDEYGDGLGFAIHYMDPQFHTFLPIEGHSQPSVEAALEQLEALEFEAEQRHAPATEETINGLPEIVIMDDRNGQDQCCIICYNEYVEGEIVTQLPCHHVFHRTCVTLWLQESGTCPVCRHVLTPVLPEAALAIDFRVA